MEQWEKDVQTPLCKERQTCSNPPSDETTYLDTAEELDLGEFVESEARDPQSPTYTFEEAKEVATKKVIPWLAQARDPGSFVSFFQIPVQIPSSSEEYPAALRAAVKDPFAEDPAWEIRQGSEITAASYNILSASPQYYVPATVDEIPQETRKSKVSCCRCIS